MNRLANICFVMLLLVGLSFAQAEIKSIRLSFSISASDEIDSLDYEVSTNRAQPGNTEEKEFRFEVYDGTHLKRTYYQYRGGYLFTEPHGGYPIDDTFFDSSIPYYGANTILKVYRDDKLIFQHRFADLCESESILGKANCFIGPNAALLAIGVAIGALLLGGLVLWKHAR